MDGFGLCANTFVGPVARDEVYMVVQYLCRPSIGGERVTEQEDGRFRVEFKSAWRGRARSWFTTTSNRPGGILAGWLGRWRWGWCGRPADQLFPGDLDDAGLPVAVDGDDEPGEPFFDELPADERAA